MHTHVDMFSCFWIENTNKLVDEKTSVFPDPVAVLGNSCRCYSVFYTTSYCQLHTTDVSSIRLSSALRYSFSIVCGLYISYSFKYDNILTTLQDQLVVIPALRILIPRQRRISYSYLHRTARTSF